MNLLDLLQNHALMAALLAWLIAQIIKVVLVFWGRKEIGFQQNGWFRWYA